MAAARLPLRCLCGEVGGELRARSPIELRYEPALTRASGSAMPLFVEGAMPLSVVKLSGSEQPLAFGVQGALGEALLRCPRCFAAIGLAHGVPGEQKVHLAAGLLAPPATQATDAAGRPGLAVAPVNPKAIAVGWYPWPSRRQLQQPLARNALTAGAQTGSCGCGTVHFALREPPLELQHCYCSMCRRASGGAFMSWMPIAERHVLWDAASTLELRRTSRFARRHFCVQCGTNLSIAYDSQRGVLWLSACALDCSVPSPASAPEPGSRSAACVTMARALRRVVHICVRDKPEWIAIPDDGLQQLQDAC